jgi:hypothetical protein
MALSATLMLCSAQLQVATARALDSRRLRELLQVRPGATCVNVESLAAYIEPWLEEDTRLDDVSIMVEGSPTDPREASFRVLRAQQTVAHRAFRPGPARCEYLQAALGLAIALALRASLLEELGEALPDDPDAQTRGWSLAAAGLATYQVLPGFAAGVELRSELGLGPSASLRFGAFGLLADGIPFDGGTGGFDAVLIAARADACVRTAWTRSLRVQACTGVLGGALYARGGASASSRSSVLAWIALPVVAALGVELSRRWSLGVEISLILPLRHLRIGVEDSSGAEVDGRSLAAVGFALSLGPMYRF